MNFRDKQINHAMYKELIDNWEQATALPIDLRDKLNKEMTLEIKASLFESFNSKKALIYLEDNNAIESVLMQYQGRNSVCVSSQIGCPMACKFCKTGTMGLIRNLSASEIVNQALFFARLLKKTGQKVDNVVFMGMGEPFLNYGNVISAIKILNDKDKFNLGARHISISTCGIIKGIERLAQENIQVNLALSLHAPNSQLRSKLMPVNDKQPLSKVMQAVDNYIKKTNRKVMFEYIMIKGINDSKENAIELSRLMKNPLFMVNLIPYNPTGVFTASSLQTIQEFKNILIKNGVRATQRFSFGQDINAACGQLATDSKNSRKPL